MTKLKLLVLKLCLTAVLQQVVVGDAATKETPEPAAFLQPRHFNPHPYENGRRIAPGLIKNTVPNNVYNQGPVRFPSNDDNGLNRGEIPHPYAKLKEKQVDYQQPAKQVPRTRHYDEETSTSKKHYAFSYTVRDKHSGDDFSHSQHQSGGAVHGSYNVQLPDGRIQIVKYTADNNGYRADVTYNLIDDHHNHNHVQPTQYQDYRQAPVLQKPIIVESHAPPPLSTPPEVLIPPAPYHHQHYNTRQYSNAAALVSAQPLYDYYKNLQSHGKPYTYQGYDNSYDYRRHQNQHQQHVPLLSTQSTPISETIKFSATPSAASLIDSSHKYHQHNLDVHHVDINSYNVAPASGLAGGHRQQIYSTNPTPYAPGSRPGLVAKIVSTTVRPPYEDITVIPVSKYHHSPTAATYTSTPSYDGYHQRKNTVLPSYDHLLNNDRNNDYNHHRHHHASGVSSTVATNLLKPHDDYYYK